MVILDYKDVYDFIFIQYLVNDIFCGVIIIYFDYYLISGRIFKFDIFGYDGFIIIRMFEDMIGINIIEIFLDDKEIMFLFIFIEVLGVILEEINCFIGCFVVLEFGIKFV